MEAADPHWTLHELLTLDRDTAKLVKLQGASEKLLFLAPGTLARYSPSGALFALVNSRGFQVLNASNYDAVLQTTHSGVQFVDFSPTEQYVVTWEKCGAAANLFVWDLHVQRCLFSFFYKKNPKSVWPVLVFSLDDLQFYKQEEASVLVFRTDQAEPLCVLQQSRITSFAVGPVLEGLVTFSSGTRTRPAAIVFYENINGMFSEKDSAAAGDASEAAILWSCSGERAIVWCQTDVDSTGRSYYGEHSLYLFSSECAPKALQIYDGPAYDVKWSPKTDEFIEISGFMPARATLRTATGEKLKELAKSHRNTVRWNSFGDLVLLGGFGNLTGDIDVLERGTLSIVGSCRAHLTVACEWAPCGRIFISATLCPRLRVDNGYKLYKYTGELLLHVPSAGDLYAVQWRWREHSPSVIVPDMQVGKGESQAYRPPGSTSDFAERFRRAKLNHEGEGFRKSKKNRDAEVNS